MKKLHFLKSIVNYVWWLSIFAFPIIVIVSILKLFKIELFCLSKIQLKIFGGNIVMENHVSVLVLLSGVLSLVIAMFVLFHFRKLLFNFSSKQIFEEENVFILKKIGHLILLSASFYMISNVLLMLSKNHIKIELGYGGFMIALAIGLFFIVLSEVFGIANSLKQENDLTI